MKLWNDAENKSIKEKLDMISVSELMENNFYIADYQRGYRWTEFEVTKLLEDLHEFTENYEKGTFYCMQPLVVYYNKKERAWEVIDGQQRLTTLYLILSSQINVLKASVKDFELFNLSYKSRPDSASFLQNIDENKKNQNIDFFHMFNASKTIEKWLSEKNLQFDLPSDILNYSNSEKKPMVKFIWYDVTDEIVSGINSSEEIFSRLNVGKIGLTNAELIKALFLNTVKKENNDIDDAIVKNRLIDVQQSKIAVEWDEVENALQNQDLWSFVYGEEDKKYSTRIEFLFDILKRKKKIEENAYFTFNEYLKQFKECELNSSLISKQGTSFAWKELMDLYHLLKNWFENRNLYHLIGFLRYKKVGIVEICELQDKADSNSSFETNLKTKIKELMSVEIENIENLNYKENSRAQLRDTLLLFNVISAYNCEEKDLKFSFKDFYEKNWDLEHVRSQTPKDPSGAARTDWILTSLQYFSGIPLDPVVNEIEKENNERMKNGEKRFNSKEIAKKIADNYKTLIENEKEPLEQGNINGCSLWELCEPLKNLLDSEQDVTTTDIYKKLRDDIFKENSTFSNEHSISNLVLLDSTTNRSYGNAFFPVKRKRIQEREKNGIYILPCTKNVFSKSYSVNLSDLMNWNDSDAQNYLKEMKECLSNI